MYTIGLDLGGTALKGGLCDEAGKIVARQSWDTAAHLGPDHVFEVLVRASEELVAAAPGGRGAVSGLGLGSPGPLSHERGIIYGAPNLPGWRDVPVRARLSAATGLPVTLENDANAAAFGEFTAGAGSSVQSIVLLTLGTGIGGGVVLDGHLVRGAFDTAAEIGHMIVIPDGRPCPCGQRGCLERYASANAVSERLVEAVQAGKSSLLAARIAAGKVLDARDVLAAIDEGDELAARIWDETCLFLAVAAVNMQHLLNPQRVILGGGLMNAGERLLGPVREHFDRQSWRIAPDRPEIVLAALGTDAGVIGAASLARLALRKG